MSFLISSVQRSGYYDLMVDFVSPTVCLPARIWLESGNTICSNLVSVNDLPIHQVKRLGPQTRQMYTYRNGKFDGLIITLFNKYHLL